MDSYNGKYWIIKSRALESIINVMSTEPSVRRKVLSLEAHTRVSSECDTSECEVRTNFYTYAHVSDLLPDEFRVLSFPSLSLLKLLDLLELRQRTGNT